jgi:hypothetical protein
LALRAGALKRDVAGAGVSFGNKPVCDALLRDSFDQGKARLNLCVGKRVIIGDVPQHILYRPTSVIKVALRPILSLTAYHQAQYNHLLPATIMAHVLATKTASHLTHCHHKITLIFRTH